MKDTPTRVFGLMCVLVGVWTTVYWLYEPGEPPVTFDKSPSQEAPASDDAEPHGPMAELSPPIVPAVEHRTEPRVAPAPTPPRQATQLPTPAGTRVVPPEYWDYTVQPNDSMESIAKKLFGDGRLWTKIAEANPFVDARKLVPGRTKLRIPKDLTNIQGKEVVLPRTQPDAAPPKTTPEPSKPEKTPAAASTTYVVKSGDTLSGIAKSFYGKSSLWRKIYEVNKGVIDDPDHVKPGITIKIPPQD